MITSRQELANYALRRLGGGVVNIEVSSAQIEDRVDDAISYFTDYHFDGIQRDYLVKQITTTSFTVADTTGFVVNDVISCVALNLTTTITAIVGTTITVSICRCPANVVLTVGSIVTNGFVSQALLTVNVGDVDKKYISVDDNIVGVNKVLNLSSVLSSGDYMFNAQYQIMMSEIKSLTSGSTQYLYSMLSYLGHLDFILKKEKDFRFTRGTNRLFIDVNWNGDIKAGEYIAVEVYRAIDDTVYAKMLNNRWLKEYTTALIKQQWGMNSKKYSGIQLPGGITYSGKELFDEATEEINNLRTEAIENSAPLEFLVG